MSKAPVSAEKISPWLSENTKKIENFACFLHSEIIDFSLYIQPSEKESNSKKQTFEKLKNILEEKIEGAELKIFGSFASTLSLKNGDIDLALVHPSFNSKKLMKFAYLVIKSHEVNYDSVELIKNAKVPLIKFRDCIGNCEIDLCFNESGGVDDLSFIHRVVSTYSEVRHIFLLMKLFLRERKLNNSFFGGMGSFLLFCMVYYFVDDMKKKEASAALNNSGFIYSLGDYLIGFLKFVGDEFDFRTNAIDLNFPVKMIKKQVVNNSLTIFAEGKTDNLASSCWRFFEITKVFKNRYFFLIHSANEPSVSILKSLINPNNQDFTQYESY